MQEIVLKTKTFICKNSSTIIAISGILLSIGLSVRAGIKTHDELLDKDAEVWDKERRDLTKKEKIKIIAKHAVAPTIMTAATIACVIKGNNKLLKKNAALVSAYNMSKEAFEQYKTKTIDILGKKSSTKVIDKVSKDEIEKNPPEEKSIIITEKGNILCYDYISGRYFRSDIETIRKKVNDINQELYTGMYISLNDYYDQIGLPYIAMGNDLGWNVSDGLLELEYSTQLTPDNEPCLVISFSNLPKPDYSRFV